MTPPTLVALAPHLDDVALSASAAVLGWRGPRVLVTVFSGDPPGPLSPTAAAFHDACGLRGDAMRHRREEDRSACVTLASEPVHLGFPEALYRTTGDGRWAASTDAELFDGSAEGEPDVLAAVTRRLADVGEAHGDARWLLPVGNGLHRDHAIVRRAAESLGLPAFGYYDDQPYGWWARPAAPPPPAGYRRVPQALDARAWETKVRALACHASQMHMLWGPAWRQRLAAEHARDGAGAVETLWLGR
jgi:LmbE family N-acetylglucosaminyl deacetylase